MKVDELLEGKVYKSNINNVYYFVKSGRLCSVSNKVTAIEMAIDQSKRSDILTSKLTYNTVKSIEFEEVPDDLGLIEAIEYMQADKRHRVISKEGVLFKCGPDGYIYVEDPELAVKLDISSKTLIDLSKSVYNKAMHAFVNEGDEYEESKY